jgi:hypothetical protein
MSRSKRRKPSRPSGQRRHAPTAGSARLPSEDHDARGKPDDRAQAIAVTEVVMAHRHKATGHATGQPDDPANVRIAVVTGPGPEVSLGNEIRLCRAALLYGDAVTLYSPNALMLASVERLGNATDDERIELLRAFYPIVEPDAGPAVLEALDQLMGLRTRRRRTREELQLVVRLEQMLKAGPAGGLRPPSGPATTRRSPGHRPHPRHQGKPQQSRARRGGAGGRAQLGLSGCRGSQIRSAAWPGDPDLRECRGQEAMRRASQAVVPTASTTSRMGAPAQQRLSSSLRAA